jgi:hypothetical protein
VNFEAPTWAGVKGLLGSLESSFREVSGTDPDGRAIGDPIPEGAVHAARNRGYAHLVFNKDAGFLKSLQVFVGSEDDGLPFVELTFFPDDVEPIRSLRSEFVAWAQQMQTRLGARQYYARYENASWRFGDTGAQSGVFLVGGDITQDA